MKATQKLHELGQSIWLDNITRDLLTSGTLKLTPVTPWPSRSFQAVPEFFGRFD